MSGRRTAKEGGRSGRRSTVVAWACGGGTAAFVLVAVGVASGRPGALTPEAPTGSGVALGFLAALVAAYAAYAIGWACFPRDRGGLAAVIAIGAAIQLVPLAGPLLVSRDVNSYAAYGRIDAELGGNPYRDTPGAYRTDPVAATVPAAWRDTPSVYGPAFTALSSVVVRATGERVDAAALVFRAIAAASVLAIALLAAASGPAPGRAAAFVAWNPLLAVHFGGGGHNDATMVALVAGGIVATARGRALLGGALWAGGVFVKWIPALLYPLWLLSIRRARAPAAAALSVAVVVLAAAATWRWGSDWLRSASPLAHAAETGSRYSSVRRLTNLGLDVTAARAVVIAAASVGALLLVRRAWRGAPVVGLAACLLLVVTPWLLPWYAVWAIGLAAAERGAAPWLALALGAYLLPARIPV